MGRTIGGNFRAVEQSHAEARRLADEQHDYAAAVQALETVPEHLRDNALYATLIESRDRAAQLEDEVRQAVRETRLAGLRYKVAALLELKPRRDDLRRFMERLPKSLSPARLSRSPLGR